MRNLLLMTAMLGLVGCVGGIEDTDSPNPDNTNPNPNPNPPPATGTAARMYEDTVYPIMTNLTAACGSCHTSGALAGGAPASSGFVGATKTGSYDILLQYPNIHGNFAANAKILSYVTLQSHQGKSYTVDEVATINAWLAAALAETGNQDPGTGPEGPGQVTERILGTFSACMTQDMFNQAQMANACGNMDSTNNTECDNCHANGGEGFIASRQAIGFFEVFSSSRSYLQKYFQVANAENPAMAKMDRNLPMFAAVLDRQGMYFEHPRTTQGTAIDNPCTQAMLTFQGLVEAKIAAGAAACGPSKLVD